MDLIAEKKDEIWAHVSEESAEKIMQSISYYLQRTEEEGEEIIRSQVLEIYNKLRCGFPLAYNKWVFSVQPCYLPEKAKLYSKEPQFEEYNSIAAVRRAEISAQLMEDGGWQAVKELA
ncbi:MAG TPA: hypothetical protein PK765_05355 [bacterium]|nr:hypothetical protein [bacterium]